MYVCAHLSGAHGIQERAQDSLELELQTLVSWELNQGPLEVAVNALNQ